MPEIEPEIRGKDPLPGSLSGPGIEALDAFGQSEGRGGKKADDQIHKQLQEAIEADDITTVQDLISRGADINQPFSKKGDTPLMWARSVAMARMLIRKGAEPDTRDAAGATALHYAVSGSHANKLAPFLVESGANVNAGDHEGETPLYRAVIHLNNTRSKDMGIISILITNGADINLQTKNGYTALMQAAATGNSPLADLLLSLGADKTLKNRYGDSARDIAYDAGARYIYQRLE